MLRESSNQIKLVYIITHNIIFVLTDLTVNEEDLQQLREKEPNEEEPIGKHFKILWVGMPMHNICSKD